MISTSYLALRIAYLAKINKRKRLTISEASLKKLAQSTVLPISYLYSLKNALEELGYFLGTLEEGGYGLFPIQSLKNAPALSISADHKEQFESYDEAQLRKKYDEDTVKDVVKINEPADINIKATLWDTLILIAKNKESITYGNLAKKLGFKHHKKLEKLLKELVIYCTNKGLPRLDYLVSKQSTELPSGITSSDDTDYNTVKEKIYQHDWNKEPNPFADKTEESNHTQEIVDTQQTDPINATPNIADNVTIDQESQSLEQTTTETDATEEDLDTVIEEKTVSTHVPQADVVSSNEDNYDIEHLYGSRNNSGFSETSKQDVITNASDTNTIDNFNNNNSSPETGTD
ncbi:hypothetical protein MTZ49_07310 [Entomomonas sp. E2T0]|uniref:hypothetical protein n=1 Tax=Entomomonas sp. E2T0 TaxID=2930213 RepID=UPI0022283B93|nr:hypothetical protein [Entomomonas sp. E2T0]UYZ85347.1 hypothetical protein MTZ49_07310 [Entomomonas sp. E2T0]